MNRFNILVAAALLVVISGAAFGISVQIANPAIYGEWQLDFNVNEGALNPNPKGADGDCVFTGDMDLRNEPFVVKTDADKVSDPVTGEAQMEVVSGNCPDFFGEISGNAFGNTIMFNLTVFPTNVAKDADKGDPLIVLVFDGSLINETLMEGNITGAFIPTSKGASGAWVASRHRGPIPVLTPIGILVMLAGLGLVGGIALRRRK